MPTERWTVGEVTITKVVELEFWTSLDLLDAMLPASSRAEIEELNWLQPDYVHDGQAHMGVYSFLIETPTRKIVVDTAVGNSKARAAESWNMLDTDYLRNFRDVWDPAKVDMVLCTHMHVDHVGWNTQLVDGRWVPTFFNADHYLVEREYVHWKRFADANESVDPVLDAASVFNDSVRPIVDAQLATLVEPDTTITPEVVLIPSPGHTPGRVSVLVESNGDSAVITGDLLHVPCQLGHPEWSNVYDTDQAESAVTRLAFLERFADTDTLVIGSHFGTPTGVHVRRNGSSFRLTPQR